MKSSQIMLKLFSLWALLVLAACSPKQSDIPTLCEGPNPPQTCRLACDPDPQPQSLDDFKADKAPPPSCPTGMFCDALPANANNPGAPKGRCNAQCTASGGQCGDGNICSGDGKCYEPSIIAMILDWPGTKWIFVILALVMPLASILTWMERRQSAMMQDRLGPNRANIGPIKLKGILHFVADAVKMIFKEDFIPANVHKALFALAPILAIAPVFVAFSIIPFGPTIYPYNLTDPLSDFELTSNPDAPQFLDAIRMQMFSIDFGLIFYFAVLTLANYGGTIAGWASYNKWALLGGLRSSSQMMSYEVAMGISLVGAFLIAGSLEPGWIVAHGASQNMSPSNPANWLWLWQPVGFVLFFTAAIAETKRAPFDIPEGEPEIIGYFVEYSGLRWGLFFLAEFIEIVFISAVITSVFLGGYQFPFLDPDGFRIGGEMWGWDGAAWHAMDNLAQGVQIKHTIHVGGAFLPLDHWAVSAIQFATFGGKVVLLCWFQLMIRWTLPRFRADQLMNLGWKWLLPIALANVMVTALFKLLKLMFTGS